MTAAAETHSESSRGVLTTRTRRMRLDLMGLGAVLLAGLGLAGTVVVTRAPAPASTTPADVSATVAFAQPARDRWYAEQSSDSSKPADLSAADTTSPSAPVAGAIARDRWYADGGVATAVAVPSQMRDRWYLDVATVSDVPKDRWYSDPGYPGP